MIEPLHPEKALIQIARATRELDTNEAARAALAFLEQHPIPVDALIGGAKAARLVGNDIAADRLDAFRDAWAPEAST